MSRAKGGRGEREALAVLLGWLSEAGIRPAEMHRNVIPERPEFWGAVQT